MHVYLHQPTSHTHVHAQFSARIPASARNSHAHKHLRTSFEKKLFFCAGEYAEYGFDQQG